MFAGLNGPPCVFGGAVICRANRVEFGRNEVVVEFLEFLKFLSTRVGVRRCGDARWSQLSTTLGTGAGVNV